MELDGSRFRLGDMVWAKVQSHPWWPGQIFDPALASSLARKSRRESHVLVAFFGDSTFGWFPESELIPFEPNFAQKSKQSVAPLFLEAVHDALEEIGRRVELGLICPCIVSIEMEERRQKGRGLNINTQLRDARKAFKPSKMIAFVKDLACAPFSTPHDVLWRAKAEAQAHAFRVTAFCAHNSQYEENFGNVTEGGDPKANDQASTQGLNHFNVKMAAQTALAEEVDLEERNRKALMDRFLEVKLVSEDLRKKEEVMRFNKLSAKLNVDTTGPSSNGCGNPKRSRKEGKSPKLPKLPPGMKGRKRTKGTSSEWTGSISNGGDSSGNSRGLVQNTTTETLKDDAPVSAMTGGESLQVQATPKKSKGFKRLLKGSRAACAKVEEPSSEDRSVENEQNQIGKLGQDEMISDSNKRAKRKSKSQSERGFDPGRPSKLKARPLMTSGESVSEPYITAARNVPGEKKNSVVGREEEEASCLVPAECISDGGYLLQEKNVIEEDEGNKSQKNVPEEQASSKIQNERPKNWQSKMKYGDLSSFGFSQNQQSGNMEADHICRERTCNLEGSRCPFRQNGESLFVSGGKGSSQLVEISGQNKNGSCASSSAVAKEMKSGKMHHEMQISKSCASENGNVSRRRGILELNGSQKASEAKRKRLKTMSSKKSPDHLTHKVDEAQDAFAHASSNSNKKAAKRSVGLVSAKDDAIFEQRKLENIVGIKELLDGLKYLAANSLGERNEQVICDVQKAFTKLRRAGLQSDSRVCPTHLQEGQNSVSSPSASTLLRVFQEGKETTNVTENFMDDPNAVGREDQGGAITETSVQLSETKTFKADVGKPEINDPRKENLDDINQARAVIVSQSSQAEAPKGYNFLPTATEGQDVKSDGQRGASDCRFNESVKDSKKTHLTSVSRKASVSSLIPPLESDIQVHGLRDAPRNFDSVNAHSKSGCEAVRTLPPSKVNRASQAQGAALMMRFPQGLALPSEAQLRGTFIHFGQLDLPRTRIYHNTSSAQVVYQHAHDAEAALKYSKENHVFGLSPVSFKLKQVPQTRDVGMAMVSSNRKESRSAKEDERLTSPSVCKEHVNAIHDKGAYLSSRNHTLYDNPLQIDTRSPSVLKSCLKKTDDSMSGSPKNGARVTFQLSCGLNVQSIPSSNSSQNTSVMDQLVVKSNCDSIDPQSHIGSSPSVQFSWSGPRQSSLGLPISTDISHQMLTLLHQVNALVSSSGIAL